MPRRPLTLRPPGNTWRAWVLALLALLLFGGAEVWIAATVVPDIVADWPIRDAAQPVPGGRLTGKCSAHFGLLQTCDVSLSASSKSGTTQRDAVYVFLEPHLGDRTARVMVDPDHPAVLTTDFAVDFFWNRVVTAVVLALVCLALMLTAIFGALSASQRRREAKSLSGRMLEAVPLTFVGWEQRKGWIISKTVPAGEKSIVLHIVWPVPGNAKPLVVDAKRGLILGLRATADGPEFPVDADLRWVEMDDAERARILAAVHLGGAPRQAAYDPDATIAQRPA